MQLELVVLVKFIREQFDPHWGRCQTGGMLCDRPMCGDHIFPEKFWSEEYVLGQIGHGWRSDRGTVHTV